MQHLETIDEEMSGIIADKCSGQRRQMLLKLWTEDVKREEEISQQTWDNKSKSWLTKYEQNFRTNIIPKILSLRTDLMTIRPLTTHKCRDNLSTGGQLDESTPKDLNLEEQDSHIIKTQKILDIDKHSIVVILMQ